MPGKRKHAVSVLEIHKFGGASLADADAVGRAASLLQNATPAVVVVSAMAGVTDALLAIAQKSAAAPSSAPTGLTSSFSGSDRSGVSGPG
jgi:aspartokinase